MFLILVDNRNCNFDGATASLMQFRLSPPPGGGMVSQQVKAQTVPRCTCNVVDLNHIFLILLLPPQFLLPLLWCFKILLPHFSGAPQFMTLNVSSPHLSRCSSVQSNKTHILPNKAEISKTHWSRKSNFLSPIRCFVLL